MSRPTTRAAREAKVQLNAYTRWNPENNQEKVERLAELQSAVKEGRAFQYGRAIVANSYNVKTHPDISREYTLRRLTGLTLGRALIVGSVRGTGKSLDDTSTRIVGDGVYVKDGALIELRDNVFLRNTTFNEGIMTVVESTVEGCDITSCEIMRSDVSNSFLDKCEINDSIISLSELGYTKVEHGTLVNVVGSSGNVKVGGRIVDAEMFYAGAQVGFDFVDGLPEV